MKDKREAILRQFRANRDANVLFDGAPRLLEIDGTFQDMLQRAAGEDVPEEELESLIGFAVRECTQSVLRINQYLSIADRDRERLASIYRRTWQRVREGGDVASILRQDHLPAVQVWLSDLYPRALSEALAREPRVRALCCADYSAELQLDVLGLHPARIVEPVLDVGCGFTAPLVRHLADRGVEARGFDRFVEAASPAVAEEDWLGYDFAARSWGTVVSHMALSNHYRYARLYDTAMVPRLEAVFRSILSSLAPGGCFAYAPGVAELEGLADSPSHLCETTPVMEGLTAVRIVRAGGIRA